MTVPIRVVQAMKKAFIAGKILNKVAPKKRFQAASQAKGIAYLVARRVIVGFPFAFCSARAPLSRQQICRGRLGLYECSHDFATGACGQGHGDTRHKSAVEG